MKQGGNPSSGFTPPGTRKSRWSISVVLRSLAGFTIIETLIVLVITSALATSAIVLINGKQNAGQFTVSLQETRQQLEQVSNQVANGFYPDNERFTCTGNAPQSPTITYAASGNSAQGKNVGCIFLGDIIHFGIDNGSGGKFYHVYPIAGNRLDQNNNQVTTLYNDTTTHAGGAEAIAIDPPDDLHDGANGVAKTVLTLHNGLTLVSMYYNGAAVNQIGAYGYLSSLGAYSGGNLASGSQNVGLYAVKPSSLNQPTGLDTATAVGQVNGGALPTSFTMSTGPIIPVSQITLCFNSGSTKQYAAINIGGGSQQLSVTTTVKSGTLAAGAAC